jgi:HK97 family phage major capsid protein
MSAILDIDLVAFERGDSSTRHAIVDGTMRSLSSGFVYVRHDIPEGLLDDAYVSIDEWLAEEVQDAFAAQETTAFVTGDGVNKPKGLLAYTAAPEASYAWGQVGYLATGVAGAWPASNPTDKLIDLHEQIAPRP